MEEILKFISPGNEAPENIPEKYNELIEMIYKYGDYVEGKEKQKKMS